MIGILHITATPPGTIAGNIDWFTVKHPDYAPHVLVDPSTGEIWRSGIPDDRPSKALLHPPGMPETNNRSGGVYQVEIVAEAWAVGSYDDEWYAWLRGFLRGEGVRVGIAWEFDVAAPRFTWDEWAAPLEGWFGHNKVPGNDHPCPTNLDVTRLLLPKETSENMPEYVLRDAANLANPWLFVYANNTLRWVGGTEFNFVRARYQAIHGAELALVDETDHAAYVRAAHAAGVTVA
jgi:hypothetical protein